MIDLEGFTPPDNSPEPGTCIRIERPEPGLAVLILDPPHRRLAVLDLPLIRDLDLALSEVESDEGLRGLVITGRAPDQFAAGADVRAIHAIGDPSVVEKVVREVHKLFLRIERLRATTVAAVGGPVPGGAFELSLCCDFIIATDDAKTRIGLPETMLGIIPGWGGSHRLPKRVGVPSALNAILTGKLFDSRRALRMGFVDRVTKPEYLTRIASDMAMGRERCSRPKRGWKAWSVDRNPLALALIGRQARNQVMAKTHGHYPAPLQALEIVLQAPRTTMEEAMNKEAHAVGRLATGPTCKNLIAIFLASEEAKKLGKSSDGAKPLRVQAAGVIGAGVMGGGIASLMAMKGVAVRLADLSRDALDEALIAHRADVAKKRSRRRLMTHEAEAAIDRLDTTTGLVGFRRIQIAIEAVAERLDVKQKVLGELAAQVPENCILATNTSSLSVDAIAEGLPRPERVCGMHFFNPVKRMPLVEIVRGSKTSHEVLTAVSALALRCGKTPVVVKDVAGFLVNRLLGPYLDEAIRLFVGGADPERIDRLMVGFGMPMGPFALLDEVGLDIASHAAESLHAAYGERMTPSKSISLFMSPERLGKKTGHGFFRHPRGKKSKPVLSEDLASFQKDSFAASFNDEQIIDRMVLSMVNEAARCLEEDVVSGPAELDLATVFGTGFAPFRGGLLRYADSQGARAITDRLEAIANSDDVRERLGGTAKFAPAVMLQEMAAEGWSFYTYAAERAKLESARDSGASADARNGRSVSPAPLTSS